MPQVLADRFITELIKAGMIGDTVIHVIIDAKVGEPVFIHTERMELDEEKLGTVTAAVLAAKVEE